MIRKPIGYILGWTLYWTGHIVSIPMYKWDSFAWLYPTYNSLMVWSYDVQIWAGLLEPWKIND